jgi:hypothetical protein
MRRIASVLASVILIWCWASAQQSAQPFLYRASLVQAAPGKLIELIDIYKARAVQEAAAEAKAGVTNADAAIRSWYSELTVPNSAPADGLILPGIPIITLTDIRLSFTMQSSLPPFRAYARRASLKVIQDQELS